MAVGTAAYMWSWGYGDYYWPDMVLARLDAAGNLDTSFGDNGRVYLDPSTEVASWADGKSELHWLTQQPDGKLVGAGSAGADMAVVRLTADGALDQSFGEDGVVRIPLGPDDAFASADAVGVAAFIPDPEFDPKRAQETGAHGLAADARGVIYGAEVYSQSVKKYADPGDGSEAFAEAAVTRSFP